MLEIKFYTKFAIVFHFNLKFDKFTAISGSFLEVLCIVKNNPGFAYGLLKAENLRSLSGPSDKENLKVCIIQLNYTAIRASKILNRSSVINPYVNTSFCTYIHT